MIQEQNRHSAVLCFRCKKADLVGRLGSFRCRFGVTLVNTAIQMVGFFPRFSNMPPPAGPRVFTIPHRRGAWRTADTRISFGMERMNRYLVGSNVFIHHLVSPRQKWVNYGTIKTAIVLHELQFFT